MFLDEYYNIIIKYSLNKTKIIVIYIYIKQEKQKYKRYIVFYIRLHFPLNSHSWQFLIKKKKIVYTLHIQWVQYIFPGHNFIKI